MKKLIIGFTSVLLSFNLYAMSFQQIGQIYDGLVKANGFKVAPRLYIDSNSSVNASSGGMRITVYRGMMDFVNNNAEMAMVLGHELAHYSLGHPRSTIPNEYAADARGAQYIQRAGYSKCQGAMVLYRLHNGRSDTHPDSTSRYKRLGC